MFCPVCGARAPGDAHFCTDCGASLDAVAAAVAAPQPSWSPAVKPARGATHWALWAGVIVLFLAVTHYIKPQAGNAAVQDVTMVRSFSDNAPSQEIASAYDSRDPFICAVRVTDVHSGQVIAAHWYKGRTLLKDTTYTLRESGNGFIGFTLAPTDGGWPQGHYHVDILLDGDKARSVDFTVHGT